jgi:hypothetical protein
LTISIATIYEFVLHNPAVNVSHSIKHLDY